MSSLFIVEPRLALPAGGDGAGGGGAAGTTGCGIGEALRLVVPAGVALNGIASAKSLASATIVPHTLRGGGAGCIGAGCGGAAAPPPENGITWRGIGPTGPV